MESLLNIKAVREAKKIKQSEVANVLGLDPSNYAKLENRGKKLTIEQLEAIGGALGVSVAELLTGIGETGKEVLSDTQKLRLAFYENGRVGLHNYLVGELVDYAFDMNKVVVTALPGTDYTAQRPPYSVEYKEDKKQILDEYVRDRGYTTFLSILRASGLYEETEIFRLWNGLYGKVIPERHKEQHPTTILP